MRWSISEEKGLRLEIIYLDEIDSTHLFLVEALKSGKLSPPIAVTSERQTGGVGSRGNRWISLDGNLFLSFALDNNYLPKDLPTVSRSIYFAMIMKGVLKELGSGVWVKWPNDFYINNKKVGGVITKIFKNITVCSMGLNIKEAPEGFAKLDINVNKNFILKQFFINIELTPSWKEIFRKFKIEFQKGRNFSFHDGNIKYFIQNAVLNFDGSIELNNGKRIYNLR